MEAVDFINFFKANLAKFACAGGLDPNNDQIPSGPPSTGSEYLRSAYGAKFSISHSLETIPVLVTLNSDNNVTVFGIDIPDLIGEV